MKYLDIYITLIDEKPHENILIYDISYKTLIGAKPLHIRFNKIDGFIRIYDGTRYLTLFDYVIWCYLQKNEIFYKSKKWHHIFFSQFCKNQNWFFTYRKKIDFASWCYTH